MHPELISIYDRNLVETIQVYDAETTGPESRRKRITSGGWRLVGGWARERIERYWDQFPKKPLPQYIECDFDYVSQALRTCVNHGWIDGQLFCEWGCGFGIVTGVASVLGLDAIGIEAEQFLCEQARKLMAKNGVQAEIWQGIFSACRRAYAG